MTQVQFVRDTEAARILGLSPQTLRNWRCRHQGPEYVKIGYAIRYKIADLLDFAEKGRVRHEAELAGKQRS